MRLRAGVLCAAVLAPLACAAAPAGADVKGGEHARKLFRHIPQHGSVLGRRSARVTLIEFDDLQCPFCREYHRRVLPTLVRRYVRRGRIKMRWMGLDFIGRDSTRAARSAYAAGTENRLWQFAEVFLANQREENTGYATDRFLHDVGHAAGVSQKTIDHRNGAHEKRRIRAAWRLAKRLDVNSVPTFFIVRRGHRPRELRYHDFRRRSFTRPIDRALRQR
jgi:protein-disulfide isomerase